MAPIFDRIGIFVPPLSAESAHIKVYETYAPDPNLLIPFDQNAIFPRHKYRDYDVIIGLKYVLVKGEAHLVFFEVRMNQGSPHAMVLDPNGRTETEYKTVLQRFFRSIPFDVATTTNVNRSDRKDNRLEALRALGFSTEDNMLTGGYCVTISMFFLIDYICTDQWRARNSDHFVRASTEWLISPEENQTGYYSPLLTDIRTILFGRYLAYKIMRLINPNPDEVIDLKKVHMEHKITNTGGDRMLSCIIWVGAEGVVIDTKNPRPISEFRRDYQWLDDGVAKRLFPSRAFCLH